jgi:NAD(P)-dependent dehydrogenase (short-subunit alcohol dehydrogenase family)
MEVVMSGRLAGKVAIITGAASGQGREAARLFASEGAQVAGFDRNAEGLKALEADTDRKVYTVVCDLSSADSVRAAVGSVVERFASINVVYNNAGVAIRRPGPWDESQDGPTADITEELFDTVIGINLKSQFLTCKYAIPHLIEAGGGSIINVASIGGVFIGATNNAYCASKGGVLGLSLALAYTYGPKGIRTNVLCPGLIDTPLVDHLLSNQDYLSNYNRTNPLGRVGQPTDVVNVGLFLASDEASYLNGAVIPIDGGSLIRAAG